MVAVLRGHVLYLYKDKSAASHGHGPTDDQPISIKSSIVDIAHDYTKRKNVFRLITFNGSEYLFQVWVKLFLFLVVLMSSAFCSKCVCK